MLEIMRKQVEILSDGIKSKSSGIIGKNSSAGGNITGRDDNSKTINIIGLSKYFRKPQKSDIFEVVKTIDKKAKIYYNTQNIKIDNPDWDEKLDYNKLSIWHHQFRNCELRLSNFENEILVKLRTADKLLNFLNQIWIENSSNSLTGDEKCQQIYDILLDIVNEGKSHSIGVEATKEGINITMYWAFTRCQILENPPVIKEATPS